MKRKISFDIKDIIEAIDKIKEFTQGMSFEDFLQDDKTASAIIRMLEIIGEATKQLPKDVLNRFSEIPWSSMAKMRDKIIHFDYEIVWKVISEDLPKLRIKIYQILRNKEQ